MIGTRHAAATRFHVPGADCSLQPINQEGRSPVPYQSNPLHPPATLPDLTLHSFHRLCCGKKYSLQRERDNESRLNGVFLLDKIKQSVSERVATLCLCFFSSSK